VYLSLDTNGAFKVFLNGLCVMVDETERKSNDFVSDPYRVAVALKPGWNTVLLKLASDKNTTATYRLRFTDLHGNNLPTMAVDPTHSAAGAVTIPDAPVKGSISSSPRCKACRTARTSPMPARQT
jgi:hypothetical protein